ncbi:RloB domain-containing protein [bacterium]|nr:RloB domain-containing protein [bacterium]
MSNDQFFYKNRAKKENELSRKRARRDSYDRVLIVCEGTKTEPQYLRKLIDAFELNTANVEIDGSSGSSPISVARHAKHRYKEEKLAGDKFDKVFCVFDKDTHASYGSAIDAISQSTPKGVFRAITSVPCFEYWLLLHFTYTTSPFVATGSRSACTKLITSLRQEYPAYTKDNANSYDDIKSHTERAIENSKRALKESQEIERDNPSTLMHELVEYLIHLKD